MFSAIADLDVLRCAALLIKHHRSDAALVAAQRADELLAKGDVEGQIVWKRIVSAINELQRTQPAAGERAH